MLLALNCSTHNVMVREGIAKSPYTFFSSKKTDDTLLTNPGYQLKRQFHLKRLLHNNYCTNQHKTWYTNSNNTTKQYSSRSCFYVL